jgi:hypothetical protein
VTHEEYQKYLNSRAFRESTLGKALIRFENAVAALYAYEGDSLSKSKRLTDQYQLRRQELVDLFPADARGE